MLTTRRAWQKFVQRGFVSGELNPLTNPNPVFKLYDGPVVPEFDHISSQEEQDWLYTNYEKIMNTPLPQAKRINTARLLLMSELFEAFVQRKHSSYKRYSGEGLEALAPCVYSLLENHSLLGGNSSVISIAHRGKLALLASVFNFPLQTMFYKFKGHSVIPQELNEREYYFIDDIATHLCNTFTKAELNNYTGSVLPNPSHLEIGAGTGLGKTRCKQDEGQKAAHIWIHGDAALSGQGIVYEAAQMSKLEAYTVGGTLHIVGNNQLGFTTPESQGRSTQWTTEVFKIIDAPIIHINAFSADEIVKLAKLALEYRERFRNDFVIDLIGYRKRGHNEVDEPAITNPGMYKVIRGGLKGGFDPYCKRLMEEGVLDEEKLESMRGQIEKYLSQEYEATANYRPTLADLTKSDNQGVSAFRGKWTGISALHNNKTVDSGYALEDLKEIAKTSVTVPDDFKVHNIVKRGHIDSRLRLINEEKADWSTAEALAFGSLLKQGYNVRFSGQDCVRGTFTQRHAGITCQETQNVHFPLSSIGPGKLMVYNSLLCELGVVGFEYGYAWENPNNLVLWEAQYGDFSDFAQSVFDQILASAEARWVRQNGLIVMLPHGQDGGGVEHSSARIERALQLVNDPLAQQVNLEVVNSIVPANYFHLLRRQMLRDFRRPIFLATPKSGLRHKLCISPLQDFAPGTSFQPAFLKNINQGSDKTLIFCSGKVYLDILTNFPDDNYSIVLVEQLAPFPSKEIQEILQQKSGVENVYWVQEEPLNSGAWHYMKDLLRDITGKQVGVISRPGISASATTNIEIFLREGKELFSRIKGIISQIRQK